MNLLEALQLRVETQAERIALVQGDKFLSYGELWQQAAEIAKMLRSLEIQRGDRVGILAEPGIESVIVFWGVLMAGAIAVNLNDSLQAEGLREILLDCEPSLVFSSETLAAKKLVWLQDILPDTRLVSVESAMSLCGDATAGSPGNCVTEVSDKAAATIVYTSGSTGTPKGVCLSHEGLYFAAQSDMRMLDITPQDSYLMLVPLHYVHGLLQLFIHLLSGASIHFAGGFLLPRRIVQQLASSGVSGFSGVPFHLIALLDRGGLLEEELPNLRWMAVTGGKFPAAQIRRILAAKPDLGIFLTYGQTECSPRITALTADKTAVKPDSVGAPPPGIDLRIVDETGQQLPQGDIGEVVVQGKNLMLGYWRDDAATADVIDSEGWLHTGDLGRLDADGDLFLVGRQQAMIKTAGERIFPEEIERIIVTFSAVAEAAVIGVPDDLYGQRVEAHIELSQGLNTDESENMEDRIRKYCLQRMAFARAPKAYHLWEKLPRKANGKVDKQQLMKDG